VVMSRVKVAREFEFDSESFSTFHIPHVVPNVKFSSFFICFLYLAN
jgi:hypothetical protein